MILLLTYFAVEAELIIFPAAKGAKAEIEFPGAKSPKNS